MNKEDKLLDLMDFISEENKMKILDAISKENYQGITKDKGIQGLILG